MRAAEGRLRTHEEVLAHYGVVRPPHAAPRQEALSASSATTTTNLGACERVRRAEVARDEATGRFVVVSRAPPPQLASPHPVVDGPCALAVLACWATSALARATLFAPRGAGRLALSIALATAVAAATMLRGPAAALCVGGGALGWWTAASWGPRRSRAHGIPADAAANRQRYEAHRHRVADAVSHPERSSHPHAPRQEREPATSEEEGGPRLEPTLPPSPPSVLLPEYRRLLNATRADLYVPWASPNDN